MTNDRESDPHYSLSFWSSDDVALYSIEISSPCYSQFLTRTDEKAGHLPIQRLS